MKPPALLLFDLGGVLVENTGFERLNALLPQPLGDADIRERWLGSAAVRQFELGRIAATEFADRFLAEWGIAFAPADFLADFATWPRGFHVGARELLRTLRSRFRVACLSNCNVLHWTRFDGFRNEFDLALSSHLLGAMKPDRESFVRTLEACGAEPDATWFFDDSLPNVHAARSVGMHAFHVDGFLALRQVLETWRLC